MHDGGAIPYVFAVDEQGAVILRARPTPTGRALIRWWPCCAREVPSRCYLTVYSYSRGLDETHSARSCPKCSIGRICFVSPVTNSGSYHDPLGDRVLGAGHEPQANMGYWRSREGTVVHSLAAAVTSMFSLVSRGAEMATGDVVVDAGCGFGTNAIHCVQHVDAQRVIGLNLSTAQIETARALTRRA